MTATDQSDFLEESASLLNAYRDCDDSSEREIVQTRLRVLGLEETRGLIRDVSEAKQRLEEFLQRIDAEIQNFATEIDALEPSGTEDERAEPAVAEPVAEESLRSVLSAGVVEAPESDVSSHERKSFSREFYETESARTPSRAEPQMICPHCGTTGQIRTRRIGRRRRRQRPRTLRQLLRKGGMLDLIKYYRESEEVLLATCLHCTASWQM